MSNHFKVRTYVFPFTVPPLIAVRTFLLNPSRLDRKSSAASLFKGSDAFGSRKRNWFNPLVSDFLFPPAPLPQAEILRIRLMRNIALA